MQFNRVALHLHQKKFGVGFKKEENCDKVKNYTISFPLFVCWLNDKKKCILNLNKIEIIHGECLMEFGEFRKIHMDFFYKRRIFYLFKTFP